MSRKYSQIFLPAELSQPQIISIPEIFKGFFACKQYQEQVIKIPEIFEDFFACRVVLAANHQYPENTQSLFACRIVLAANHKYPGNIQTFFRLQNCLSSKSLTSRKFSKIFLACRVVLAANHQNPGRIQRLFCLQNCLCRKSSVSRKYSKTFSPAELSQPRIIKIPNILKDLLACRFVLAPSHQNPENIRRLFRQQSCLNRKSSVFRNLQRLFRLQSCLSRKSSITGKYSKILLPAEFSQPQIINIPEKFKDFISCRSFLAANYQYPEILKEFFACRFVVAANHQYPENIQRLFRLQICRSRKSSVSRKYSKTFSPADLSQPQIISIPIIFKEFFACRIVLAQCISIP